MTTSLTVSEFLHQCFTNGTLPRSFEEFRYSVSRGRVEKWQGTEWVEAHDKSDNAPLTNFFDFFGNVSVETIDFNNPEQEEKAKTIEFAPVWPPDLFASTLSLLEKSSGYQIIKPSAFIHPNADLSSRKIENGSIFSLDVHSPNKEQIDPFGIMGFDQIVLSLVGLLWNQGCLFFPSTFTEQSNFGKGTPGYSAGRLHYDYAAVAIAHAAAIFHRFSQSSNFSPTGQPGDWVEWLTRVGKNRILCDTAEIRKITSFGIGNYLATNLRPTFPETGPTTDRWAIGATLIIESQCLIQSLWQILVNCKDPVVAQYTRTPGDNFWQDPRLNENALRWQSAAARLMIIADEACQGLGFFDAKGVQSEIGKSKKDDAIPHEPQTAQVEGSGTAKSKKEDGSQIITVPELWKNTLWLAYLAAIGTDKADTNPFPRTMCRMLNDELGAVLPRARTSQVGCTTRSLSHNVCFLPPRGRVRARWGDLIRGGSQETLNLLLIPYPYRIHAQDFSEAAATPLKSFPSKAGRYFKTSSQWGRDRIGRWLKTLGDTKLRELARIVLQREPSNPLPPDDLNLIIDKIGVIAVSSLVKSLVAHCDSDVIDGIILPEIALSWKQFDHLSTTLHNPIANDAGWLKPWMLISGVNGADPALLPNTIGTPSTLPEIEGNFVATFMFPKVDDATTASDGAELTQTEEIDQRQWGLRHVRAKHHRWVLGEAQLADYAISHRLSPAYRWWEGFDIHPREMLFAEFLPGSVLTTLICEDLARIEPCQIALRAVGPSLVIALLMDSAQIKGRWPHQYAGVLADDPGSSVLTCTSFGLIGRSNRSAGHSSRSFAMWRQPTGLTKEIDLPPNHHGVMITLTSTETHEYTLDGRDDRGGSGILWKFAGQAPVKLPDSVLKGAIVTPESAIKKPPESVDEKVTDWLAANGATLETLIDWENA